MILKFYRTLQYLSIDIVIGAVILLHFFSHPFDVSIPTASYLLLGCVVWLIYTADHLRDAKLSANPGRARYLFHLKHETPLKASMTIVLLISGCCLFFLPQSILLLGGVLLLLCICYLIFQSILASVGLKECYVAGMYAAGILVSPVALSSSFDLFSFLALFVLALSNLLLFSWFEIREDRAEDICSIATQYGGQKTERIIQGLIVLGLALGFSALWSIPVYSFYLVLVLLMYWLLLSNPSWASRNQRYRTIGDGAFVLPLLFELL